MLLTNSIISGQWSWEPVFVGQPHHCLKVRQSPCRQIYIPTNLVLHVSNELSYVCNEADLAL